MLRYADPTLCALGSAVFCRLFDRADSAHTRPSRCALCQGTPHSEAPHRSRCARSQGPAVTVYVDIDHDVLAMSPSQEQVCTPTHRCLNRRVMVRAS